MLLYSYIGPTLILGIKLIVLPVADIIMMILYTYIPLTLYPRRGSRGILDIPPRRSRFTIAMRNTADVTG
jgi:hypothetical protein